MESFQEFLVDLKIDGKEITPNINKLARESQYFPNFYQNVGQGNTSDAEFVVNTSFYIPPRERQRALCGQSSAKPAEIVARGRL